MVQSTGMCLPSEYFTNYTARKAILYLFAAIYVICCGVVSIFEPFLIQYAKVDCPIEHDRSKGYLNASYDTNPCMETHLPILLYFTPKQCSFGRRIVIATLLGGLIGWERRNADRPAGIRTMSLVSLGSCLFSICSAFAFANGPENWDGSRVAAAIPSGVGFLGAGLIYKEVDNQGGGTAQQVHGLTTAASLWLSAAVGIACSGELYFAATFSVAVVLVLLRFGPRTMDADETEDDDNNAHIAALFMKQYGSVSNNNTKLKSKNMDESGRTEHSAFLDCDPEMQRLSPLIGERRMSEILQPVAGPSSPRRSIPFPSSPRRNVPSLIA